MRIKIEPSTRWARSDGLRYLAIGRVRVEGGQFLQVSVTEQDLYLPMYQLINDVCSRVKAGQTDGASALKSALDGFERVVAKLAQPSKEAVIGLIGELWVLDSLLSAREATVDAWIGQNKEMHDFRLIGVDLEVKTTTANSRTHTIHGLNQLRPSPGNALRLVSIQLGSAGLSDGFSLNDLVSKVEQRLAQDPWSLKKFQAQIGAFGVVLDGPECELKYKLASPPMIIEIGRDTDEVPRDGLSSLLGDDLAARARDVQFKLNVDGLGSTYDSGRYGAANE